MRLGLGLGTNRARRVAQWLPDALGAKRLWTIDPSAPGATVVSGRYSAIPDAYGGGVSATQSTALARPLRLSDTVGRTRDVLSCDGSTVGMYVGNAANSDAISTGPGTLYLVCYAPVGVAVGATGATVTAIVSGQQNSNYADRGVSVSVGPSDTRRVIRLGRGSGNVAEFASPAASHPLAAWEVLRVENTGTALELYRNGTLLASASVSSLTTAVYPFALGFGGLGAFGAGTSGAPIRIAYASLFTGLTSEDRALMSTYLSSEFGLAG